MFQDSAAAYPRGVSTKSKRRAVGRAFETWL